MISKEVFKELVEDNLYYVIALTIICVTSFNLGLLIGFLITV
jgi:hypothetical protein